MSRSTYTGLGYMDLYPVGHTVGRAYSISKPTWPTHRVVITLDRSGSMAGESERMLLGSALAQTLANLPDGVEVCLVGFREEAHMISHWTRLDDHSRVSLLSAGTEGLPTGCTRIASGITLALNLLADGGTIICLSDGGDGYWGLAMSWLDLFFNHRSHLAAQDGPTLDDVACRARLQGVAINCIGIGAVSTCDQGVLSDLANKAGGTYRLVSCHQALARTLEPIRIDTAADAFVAPATERQQSRWSDPIKNSRILGYVESSEFFTGFRSRLEGSESFAAWHANQAPFQNSLFLQLPSRRRSLGLPASHRRVTPRPVRSSPGGRRMRTCSFARSRPFKAMHDGRGRAWNRTSTMFFNATSAGVLLASSRNSVYRRGLSMLARRTSTRDRGREDRMSGVRASTPDFGWIHSSWALFLESHPYGYRPRCVFAVAHFPDTLPALARLPTEGWLCAEEVRGARRMTARLAVSRSPMRCDPLNRGSTRVGGIRTRACTTASRSARRLWVAAAALTL